jgi:two-component system, LytTR family, response regulator
MIKVIIADDEPPVRTRMRALLAHTRDFDVVAECADGLQTLEAVEQYHPDVLFLDIQMPGLDGLEVVDAMAGNARVPLVVFVTAYEEYAVHAFDLEAVDYVVKPIAPDRLQRSLERIRSAVAAGGIKLPNVETIAPVLPHGRRYVHRLVIRTGGRVLFIPLSEVEWLEAADNYVRVHTRGHSHVMRSQLSALSARLDPAAFLRVHRSAIINLNALTSLQPKAHGEFVAHLRSGAQVPVSRTHSGALREVLKQVSDR